MSEPLRQQNEKAKDAIVSQGVNGENRRQQLIAAAMRAIARHGLSGTTLAKVAQEAGLSTGIVSFYFAGKEELLLSLLRSLSDEFAQAAEGALAAAGADAGAGLEALAACMLDPAIASPEKLAVWHAFWGEASARKDYQALCGQRDAAYYAAILERCRMLAAEAPAGHYLHAEAVAHAFGGLLDQYWQGGVAEPIEPAAARRMAAAFLASVFPWRFTPPDSLSESPSDARSEALPLTLPGWTYSDPDFYALEKERVFLPAWHLVGHVNEVPAVGDYMTWQGMGERAFVIRGKDGVLRAFHNVCRHRAHAVVEGQSGQCRGAIVCPYHAWTFDFDGRLKAMAAEKTFPAVDKERMGLVSLELEVYLGFVFIRFRGGEPSVAERFAPYHDELAAYRLDEMEPLAGSWEESYDVDWKNQIDNFLEGYHVPVGHPGLYDLFGHNYAVDSAAPGIARAIGTFDGKDSKGWAVRHYRKLLPEVPHLSAERQRIWAYYSLFPAVALDVYPDQMDFFQVVPLGPGRSKLVAKSYGLPDKRPEMRAARYLNNRINSLTQEEDISLIYSVQEGLSGSGYAMGLFSEREVCLQAFHAFIKERIPEAASPHRPGASPALQGAMRQAIPRA